MDRIDFQCPFCERPMHAPAGAAGKQGRCKSCRQNVIVPRKPQPEESEPFKKVRRPIVPRWLRTPGMIVAALLLAGIAYNVANMTRTSTWFDDDGLTMYVDQYGRWNKTVQHREITKHTETLDLISRAAGPMSESGQPHGQWEITIYEPNFHSETVFFWYGDSVSEGEWRTRSK